MEPTEKQTEYLRKNFEKALEQLQQEEIDELYGELCGECDYHELKGG